MDPADKTACADCIQAWGFARDQARWPDLLDTFHPDGHIHVSWFNGPFADFVARCREQHGKGSSAKHLLWPSRVQGHGPRATAETNVAILVRQNIDGVAVDVTSHARFLDRLERRGGVWRIIERACVYERDRLDPVEPSPAFGALMPAADTKSFPPAYRYMGFRLAAAGRSLAEPVHYDGRAETESLKVRYAGWLDGK
jgi:hypothetical protein